MSGHSRDMEDDQQRSDQAQPVGHIGNNLVHPLFLCNRLSPRAASCVSVVKTGREYRWFLEGSKQRRLVGRRMDPVKQRGVEGVVVVDIVGNAAVDKSAGY